jgi:hypothetical protein
VLSRQHLRVQRAIWGGGRGQAVLSPSDDEVGGLQRAIRARDVRAADLQEEPTRSVERELILRPDRFVGSDEDGGSRRTSQ